MNICYFTTEKKKEILPWKSGPIDALNFPQRTVESLMSGLDEFKLHAKALDVGCAVGASTFVLGKYFDEVLELIIHRVLLMQQRN